MVRTGREGRTRAKGEGEGCDMGWSRRWPEIEVEMSVFWHYSRYIQIAHYSTQKL